MSELRKDPVTGHTVIVAENRAARPDEFAPLAQSQRFVASDARATCPFCAGNEHLTPHSVAEYPRPSGEHPPRAESATNRDMSWQVRVVPNKYPAVDGGAESAVANRNPLLSPPGSEISPGTGRHEVIVESPHHLLRLTDLSDEQVALVFRAYRDRLAAAARESGLAYGIVFKNQGPAAGASLEHLHSQLMALPFLPLDVARELQLGVETHRRTGRCAMCALLDHELTASQRIVAVTPDFVALCPYASRVPYETWLVPSTHASRFDSCSENLANRLAQFARRLLICLETSMNRPDYNYLIRSAPFDTSPADHYHWRMEVLPRTTRFAGFEWGSGCYINPVAPERAAAELRVLAEPQSG